MSKEKLGFDERAKTWDEDPMKTARAHAVADAIRAADVLKPGMHGLEFGCGTGLLSFALKSDLERITLADTSAGMLDVLRQKIADAGAAHMEPLMLDPESGTMELEGLDLIYSLMVLHHVSDTEAIIGQFRKALAPGGILCIADLDAEDGSFHAHDPAIEHHGFERNSLAQLCTRAGFMNIRFSTVFSIRKGSPEQEYPVFLMIAEKA